MATPVSRLCFYRLKCVSHLQSVFLEVQLIVDWYLLQYPKCASIGWAAFHSQSVFLLVQLVPKCPELCSYWLCCGPYSVCVPNDAADYDSIRFDSMSRLCSYWLSRVPYLVCVPIGPIGTFSVKRLCSYWLSCVPIDPADCWLVPSVLRLYSYWLSSVQSLRNTLSPNYFESRHKNRSCHGWSTY